jgi:hypothetical protein
MKRGVYLIVPLLALAVTAAACGDGNGAGEKPEASVTAEATSAPETTVTPDGETTPGEPATVGPSSRITPIPGARLAVLSDDAAAFLRQFGENIPGAVDCASYDEDTGLVDCTDVGRGTFQLDPPVPVEVEECGVVILNDEVVWVSCNTELSVFIYEVAE